MRRSWKDFSWEFDGEWHEYRVHPRVILPSILTAAAHAEAKRRGHEVRTRVTPDGATFVVRIQAWELFPGTLTGQAQVADPGGQDGEPDPEAL